MASLPDQSKLQAEGRKVAIVLAAAALIWVGAQALIAALGLEQRFLILADLAAGAAFIWALVVTWRISRQSKRRRNAGSAPNGRDN
ncbi:DUF5337 family protein [Albirhodobacter sp. R86504]|uniref:DUF5337 family protein n=1 Tax=Albirhodobacter sp. R86504 TaxID=3093848 RepID=UPI00366BCFA3